MPRIGVLMAGRDDPEASARCRVRESDAQIGLGRGTQPRGPSIAGPLATLTGWPHRAADLVPAPDVILANSTAAARSPRSSDRTVPIVFVRSPIRSAKAWCQPRPPRRQHHRVHQFRVLDRPKWLEMLKEVVPQRHARRAALQSGENRRFVKLVRPRSRPPRPPWRSLDWSRPRRDAARSSGVAALAREPNGGLIVCRRSHFTQPSRASSRAAARHRLPAVYPFRRLRRRRRTDVSYWPRCGRPTGVPASTSTASSRAPSRPICRSGSRPSTSSSSTSRPPRRSASMPPTLLARADEVIE